METNCPKRTYENFKSRLDIGHHKDIAITTLEERLDMKMITTFVFDYMHCTTIGVCKRFIGQKIIFQQKKIEELNCRLLDLIKCIPHDFPRKLEGGLQNTVNWKATEDRLLMLYVGPVLLKDVNIPQRIYNTFLMLTVAMRIVLCRGQTENVSLARSLLINFVSETVKLFRKFFCYVLCI